VIKKQVSEKFRNLLFVSRARIVTMARAASSLNQYKLRKSVVATIILAFVAGAKAFVTIVRRTAFAR